MMDLPIRPASSTSTPLRQKLTLTTLPTDIKDEIFSYLLLGKNVKCFKPGTAPGYAYTFHMNITHTSKQFYKEANSYLRAHNSFALIHMQYARLSHNFCPYVAKGKEARSFKNPAIEATIVDMDPKAINPDPELEFCMGSIKVPTERILFLAQDLPHFCRHLQLEIHVWPSSQIYVHPDRGSTVVQHTPINVKNTRKIVWKVNASHRSDLTVHERRARQRNLISSISNVVGHDIDIQFLGVEQDIATQAIAHMTPRIVSVDAAGWNLLENMQSQKRLLDESLVRGPHGSKMLRRAYVMLAQSVNSSRAWLRITGQHNAAFLLSTPYRPTPPLPVSRMSFRDHDDFQATSSPWFNHVFTTALECLFNAMSLALDVNDFDLLSELGHYGWILAGEFGLHGVLPPEINSLAVHYTEWTDLFCKFSGEDVDLDQVREVLRYMDMMMFPHQADYTYRKEDYDYMKGILTVSLLVEIAVCCLPLLTCGVCLEWVSR